MTIDAKTKLYGLLAHPSQHSLSPVMHNLSFQYHNLNATYLAFDVVPENVQGALQGIRAMDIGGVNLSMPLKTVVLPYLDAIDPTAKLIGAVNTIKNDHGHLTGYNTDGIGLLKALPKDFEPQGAQVVLLGAGGAAKSVAVQCGLAGVAHLTIVNRHVTPDSRAVALQKLLLAHTDMAVDVQAMGDATQLKNSLKTADLLINATNLGMGAHIGENPLPGPDVFTKDCIVFDMIYAPAETALLHCARTAGLTHVYNGIGMLVQQGAAAFKIWTGLGMPTKTILEKLELN